MPLRHFRLLSFAVLLIALLTGCLPNEATETRTTPATIPLPAGEPNPVEVVIAQRSGVLSLSGGAGPLLDASFTHAAASPPEIVHKTTGDGPARLIVRQPQASSTRRSPDSKTVLNLSPAAPISLKARLGTGLYTLALGGLNVQQADIRVGGGSATVVDLTGYWPADAAIDITAGPGSVSVLLPRGTGARVDVFGEKVHVDEGPLNVAEPGVYTNSAYPDAPRTLSVRVVAFGGEVNFAEGLPADRTIAEALEAARTLYSAEAWGCLERSEAPGSEHPTPQTVGEMWDDYICERGPEHITLDGSSPLTAELARSELLDRIRRSYYAGTDEAVEDMLAFNISEFVSATGDVLITMQERDEMAISITHFIGSFEYSVEPEGDRLRYTVTNQTDLASGTHIPLRFPDAGYTATVESLVEEDPLLAQAYIGEVIVSERYPIVALLDPKTRAQTADEAGEGGGVFVQTFTWTEARIPTGEDGALPPWPEYTSKLDLR